MPRKATLLVAAAALLAAIAMRVPTAPRYLYYEDSINFAQAVDRYDPRHLVPQPPGYPLFVVQAKILRALTGSVENAFLWGVILATAIALFAMVMLVRSLGATDTERPAWLPAICAAALLAINPVFLYTGYTSPLRVYLAAVSLAVAFACWRAWQGDARTAPQAAWIGAIVLGIGSGYRPELLAVLFPLWAVSAWRAFGSAKRWMGAAALLAFTSALWIGVLLSRFPDLAAFVETFRKYVNDQSRDVSPVFGAMAGWKVVALRTGLWNGTAIAGWAVLAPLARPKFARGAWGFLALWLMPSLLFHAVVHLGDPDQALDTIPVFCAIGGVVLASVFRRNRDVAILAGAFVALFNLAIIYAPFPLKAAREWYTPFVETMYYTSHARHAGVQERTDELMPVFRTELQRSRTLVMWNRSLTTWRTLSYYFPDQRFCLLLDDPSTGNKPHAAIWRGLELQERITGAVPVVPLEDAEQLIWVLGPTSPVRAASAHRLDPRAPGLYRSTPMPLDVPGYRIVR